MGEGKSTEHAAVMPSPNNTPAKSDAVIATHAIAKSGGEARYKGLNPFISVILEAVCTTITAR